MELAALSVSQDHIDINDFGKGGLKLVQIPILDETLIVEEEKKQGKGKNQKS